MKRHLRDRWVSFSGRTAVVIALLWIGQGMAVAQVSLEDIGFASLSGDDVQVRFKLSGPITEPTSFATDTPPRIALDFIDTSNGMAQRTTAVNAGVVESVTTIEAGNRTRAVINLTRTVPYTTEVQGNEVVLTINSGQRAVVAARAPVRAGHRGHSLEKVDFHRGPKGSGRVLLKMSGPDVAVSLSEQGSKLILDLPNTALPRDLEQRLDVGDFATPVKSITTRKRGRNIRIVIESHGAYEHLAYQTGDVMTVELRPLSRDEQAAKQREKERNKEFDGERLSLNFQNIEVRAVLQLLADFTGLNIVVSDEVQGSVTLRLQNVPWDQALDIILNTKQLGMRRVGNVLLIAPAERLHAQEKQQLEAEKVVADLAPLRSELIQLNYASATTMASLLKEKENSLLSGRGNVAVDERTNTLLVQDTTKNLGQVRALITELDIPIRQVLIESRIVVAASTFARELGVRFGFTGFNQRGDNGLVTTSGTLESTNTANNSAVDQFNEGGPLRPTEVGGLGRPGRLNVDLPVQSPAGTLALALLGADYLIDLELSALQSEGQGEVISNPRVLTGNNQEAVIEQGQETKFIARGDNSSSLDSIEALLQLKVTPTITPDDRVLMKLEIKDDRPGQQLPDRIVIDRRRIVSNVLVDNGETVVIGGIYQEDKTEGEQKVPFLGDVPVLGYLFKTRQKNSNRRELLVFITPRIVKEALGISERDI